MSGPPSQPGFRTSPPPQQQQQPPHHEQQDRRYDPRHDARDSRDYEHERHDSRNYPVSPEGTRRNPPPHVVASNSRSSESPHPGSALPDSKDRRRRPKEREQEIQPQHQPLPQPIAPQMSPQYPPIPTTLTQEPASKKERQDRRKKANSKKSKDESTSEGIRAFGAGAPGNFKSGYSKGPSSPEASSNGSGSSHSIQPSPTSATPRPPSRVVDEDYDEGVADALINLSSYRAPDNSGLAGDAPSHSPTISSAHSRHSNPSPRPPHHRSSTSSKQVSPPPQSAHLKRALSPGPEENENKRSRVDMLKRRISPSGGIPSTRLSPIPFRTQPASHSPEARQPHDPYPPSPSLPSVLPPHPRPIGVGTHVSNASTAIALPPIATLSPQSTAASPSNHGDRDDKMHVDGLRSSSPPSRGKLSEVMHPSRSPPAKNTSPTSEKEPSSS